MQENYTLKLLGLEDISITKIAKNEKSGLLEVSISSETKTCKCPCCQKSVSSIHDRRIQRINHCSAHVQNIVLILNKKRFICKSCNKRFYETLDFLGRYQRRTKEFVISILDELKETVSIKSVANRFNVSSPSVTRLMKHFALKRVVMPRVLCIDEFKGNAGGDKYQCILVDYEKRQILDILPSRRLQQLESYFTKIPLNERENVEYVVMDMSHIFKSVMTRYFPNAQIVIDKFHFVRQCYWALENIRKKAQQTMNPTLRKYYKRSKSLLRKKATNLTDSEKEQLTIMLNYNEEIRKGYFLKECFSVFLDADSKDKASLALNSWLKRAKESCLTEYRGCITAFNNWKDKILNYFDTKFTNAVTEGFNNKIKVIKRVSYGYRNFDNFKYRIMMCCS